MNGYEQFKRNVISEFKMIDIVERNEHVLLKNTPEIAEFSYLHSFYSGICNDRLSEALISPGLPKDIVDAYSAFNGCSLFCDAISIFGVRGSHDRDVESVIFLPFDIVLQNNCNLPTHINNTICVGCYKYDGTRIIYNVDNGSIFLQSQNGELIWGGWEGFLNFLTSEYRRLSTLFKLDGHKKNGVTSTLPSNEEARLH